MKLIYIIIIVDIVLLLIFVKFIFGNEKTFTKAIAGHIFSDFADDFETFRKWDKDHNIKHKMNLFYTAILGICGGSFLLYTQL